MTLHKDGGLGRVDATRNVQRRGRSRRVPELLGAVGQRDGVQVHDTEVRVCGGVDALVNMGVSECIGQWSMVDAMVIGRCSG